jgi:DNA-binding CsgD family transcriptional regulator
MNWDIDRAHESARRWVGELTGKSGAELDALMKEGAEEGHRIEAAENGHIKTGDGPPIEVGERFSLANIRAAKSKKLSPAELRVLNLIADGMTIKEAALFLERSEYTLMQHMKVARRRLGAKNTPHAIRLAIRSGELKP